MGWIDTDTITFIYQSVEQKSTIVVNIILKKSVLHPVFAF